MTHAREKKIVRARDWFSYRYLSSNFEFDGLREDIAKYENEGHLVLEHGGE